MDFFILEIHLRITRAGTVTRTSETTEISTIAKRKDFHISLNKRSICFAITEIIREKIILTFFINHVFADPVFNLDFNF